MGSLTGPAGEQLDGIGGAKTSYCAAAEPLNEPGPVLEQVEVRHRESADGCEGIGDCDFPLVGVRQVPFDPGPRLGEVANIDDGDAGPRARCRRQARAPPAELW